MKQNQTDLNSNLEEDSIDLIAIVKQIWKSRKLIIKASFISFIIGCIVALASPIIYESQTTFVPQTSDQSSSSSINKNLGSLASLAGINLNAEAASSLDNYISPLLYSKIVESEEFSINLMKEELITLDGDRFSIKDYLLADQKSFSIIGFIKKYTIGLFTFGEIKESANNQHLENYNFISEQDYTLVKIIKNKFSIVADEKEGYIKVLAFDKDAFISTQLVKLITKNLQSRIISLRTNKIKEQVDYSREQFRKKQVEFEILQKKLAEFKDSNKNISTAVFLSERQKLESEYQVQYNILITLANEFNHNKIKLNKDTPIFSVLDEVSVPNKRSKPKRKQIVLIFVFFGILISTIFSLTKETFKEIIQKIRKIKTYFY